MPIVECGNCYARFDPEKGRPNPCCRKNANLAEVESEESSGSTLLENIKKNPPKPPSDFAGVDEERVY